MNKMFGFLTAEMVENFSASHSNHKAEKLEFELMKIAKESSGEDLPGRLCAKLYEVLPRPQSKEEALSDAAYIQYILSLRNTKPSDPAVSTLKNLLG